MLGQLQKLFGAATIALGVGTSLLAFPKPAAAFYEVCNRDSLRAYVAIAYFRDELDSWVSEGWWHVEPGQCVKVISEDLTQQYYYLYAIDDNNGEWPGEYQFCVTTRRFTIADAQSECSGDGKRWEGFFEVNTRGATDWRTELEP